MAFIFLIRHGENEFVRTGRMAGRLPNVHLNQHGKQQARNLGENLCKFPITAIYSSPLERAIETAEPLSVLMSLPIISNEGFLETNIGDWTGQEVKTIRKLKEWKTVTNYPSRFQFPNGESFLECQNRLVAQVENLIKLHNDKEIISIFLHADPIKLLTSYYLGMSIDNFQKISCDTGSVTIWNISPGNANLIKLNQQVPFVINSQK